MANQYRPAKKTTTAGDIVTARAFQYAGTFFDFADKKYAELKTYPADSPRVTVMQAAIIVSALIAMERRAPGDGISDLHNGVSQAFAPSVRYRILNAIQDLSVSLLQLDPASLKQTVIPSYAKLKDLPDEKILKALALWMIHRVTRKKVLEPGDEIVAAAMARSAWNSGIMIARMLKRQ